MKTWRCKRCDAEVNEEFAYARCPVCETRRKPVVEKLGTIGPAPTRATTFPDGVERKQHPVASGVLDYFPDALVMIAKVSKLGNDQHNPGEPLHWARSKSTDEADALIRHFLQRGTVDDDGVLHSAKMAWRALALLQKEIESNVRLAANVGGVK